MGLFLREGGGGGEALVPLLVHLCVSGVEAVVRSGGVWRIWEGFTGKRITLTRN